MKYTAIVNGKTYEVEIERASTGRSIGHAAAPAAAPVQAAPAAPAPAAAPHLRLHPKPLRLPLQTAAL